MSRQLFYISVLSLTLSACSSVDNRRAHGDFDYENKPEAKELIIPENLDKLRNNQEFKITSKINHQGPVGKDMDVRAPSLVLPLADSSRALSESDSAIIWFDKVIEEKDLLTFIKGAFFNKLTTDGIGYKLIESTNTSDGSVQGQTELYESQWYHNEVETGWLFTEVELSTSMRFRYEFFSKPHGRSVSLKVSLIDYMKTDAVGGSKSIDPIDQHRAEMAMLNEIIGQVDYNYRLDQRDNRLMRANQKLVTIGENKAAEASFLVEMSLDNLWNNMPIFFEKYGFVITDLNETNKTYFVDFNKPENSLWDSIWGDEIPVVDLNGTKYQFVLAQADENDQKTSVTIYNEDGTPLPLEALKHIFPVIEMGLSFRSVY